MNQSCVIKIYLPAYSTYSYEREDDHNMDFVSGFCADEHHMQHFGHLVLAVWHNKYR